MLVIYQAAAAGMRVMKGKRKMKKVNKNSASYKVGLVIGWGLVASIAVIAFLLLAAVIKVLAGLVF